MNHINSIHSFPLKARQTIRPDIRPTKVDFNVTKATFNGQTRLTFTITPSVTTWTIVDYTIKFKNNSLSTLSTAVLPCVLDQTEYTYDYGIIHTYAFKITLVAQYRSKLTGEILNFESIYYKQP